MDDEKELQAAKKVYATLCQALEKHEWHFKRNDEKLVIDCGAQGEDLPISINIVVDPERCVALLLSKMPFNIQEDKRIDLALAVSAVNNALVDGSFDYDVASGTMFFRMTNSFIDSEISEELFTYMLFCSCQTIDEYNDKFLMVSKGMISVEQFISFFNK